MRLVVVAVGSMNDSEAEISLRVYPNAALSEVLGSTDGVWRVKVAAPPVEGKANRELIALLSQVLGVSKSRLSMVRGHTSRSKIVAVDGLSQAEAIMRLSRG